MKNFSKFTAIFFIGIYLSGVILISPAHSAPRLANYFLHNQINDAQARELSRWDLLILDMEMQYTSPAQIDLIRRLNPDVIILAYITSEEIRDDATTQSWGPLRKKLASGIDPSWYLTDTSGNRMSFWSGTSMLNASDLCPSVGGQRFSQYLARFVSENILSSGKWDGVFYDNGWEKLSWFTGSADLNRDGRTESDMDARWQAGMKEIFDTTRRLTGGRYLVVTNGTSRVYRDNVNGIMSESFPAMDGWHGTMSVYYFQDQGTAIAPRVVIINNNTRNSGNSQDYRAMRYGLASTMMAGGYYSFDHGNQDHGQTWWYDEYGVKLGEPTGAARSVTGASNWSDGVWRREFENGIAVVNSGAGSANVDLGGDYEKIKGTQDKAVNSGMVVDRVTVGARDGIILLKTYQSLDDIFFSNGSFARFFDASGARSRNGFFIFETGLPGGARAYLGDIKGDGQRSKVILSGPRLTIVNGQGGWWYNDYPFNPDLTANLSGAVGSLSGEISSNLIIAPPRGGIVNVYNYHGALIKRDIRPIAGYTGPLSIAIGDVDADGHGEAVFAAAGSGSGEVIVYDYLLQKIKYRFFPIDKKYRDGLLVAVGDVSGDDRGEIIVAPLKSKTPLIRVFDKSGKKLSEFSPGAAVSASGFLAVKDVDFDGKGEIVLGGN